MADRESAIFKSLTVLGILFLLLIIDTKNQLSFTKIAVTLVALERKEWWLSRQQLLAWVSWVNV